MKGFEGLRTRAGRLQEGGWTVGYGHTLTAREGVEVSDQDAEALLIYDLRQTAQRVRPLLYTPLNQNEFDALVAFSFNVGPDALQSSELLKRLNEGDHLGAAAALERWRTAEFEGERLVIDALVRRRATEKALFLRPVGGYLPAPTPLLKPLYDANPADPIDAAMRARAVALEAKLDGEPTLRRIEQAAQSVSRTLRERFAGPAETAESFVPTSSEAEPPAPFDLPQASDAAPLEEAEPYPGPETAGLEPPAPEAEAFAETATAPPQAATAAAEAEAEALAPQPRSRGTAVIVGVVGLVLFCGALFSILSERANALNLLGGLFGAVCIAYAAAHLLSPKPEDAADPSSAE